MIRMLLSLLVLLGVAAAIHMRVVIPDAANDPFVRGAMSIGLLILAAWLTGELFAKINLPRISGYMILGIVLGPSFAELVMGDEQLALIGPSQVIGTSPALQFASDLAIALIALTAGSEIKLHWLKGQFKRISIITGMKLASVWVVMSGAVFVAEWFIPGVADAPVAVRAVMAILVGLVAAANSPAVVMAVINETNAKGPLSQTTLAVTIAKDMAMVVLFAATLAIGKGFVDESTALSPAFLLGVVVQLGGSLAVGVAIGLIMAWYTHHIGDHLIVFLIGACLFIALIGEQMFTVAGQTVHLEPLLIALAAGMLMENLWPETSEPLFESVESMSLPVYCVFFAIAGAKLDLGMLIELWYFVLALVAVRSVSVWASVTTAAHLTGCDEKFRKTLWLGFVPQAGIALALSTIIAKAFAGDATIAPVIQVLVGMIAVHQVVGPIGFRWALMRSGEPNAAAEKSPKSEAAPA